MKCKYVLNSSINYITHEFNKICLTTHQFNKFWSKYIYLILSLYISTNALLLYILIYESLDLITLISISTILFDTSLLLFVVTYSGSSLSSQFNDCYNKFHSLYIQSIQTRNLRSRIKVSIFYIKVIPIDNFIFILNNSIET